MQAAMPEQRTGQFEQHQEGAGLLFISGTAGHRRASVSMPWVAQERAAPAPSAAVYMAIFDATDPLVHTDQPANHQLYHGQIHPGLARGTQPLVVPAQPPVEK
jgi:hypothetical protein